MTAMLVPRLTYFVPQNLAELSLHRDSTVQPGQAIFDVQVLSVNPAQLGEPSALLGRIWRDPPLSTLSWLSLVALVLSFQPASPVMRWEA